MPGFTRLARSIISASAIDEVMQSLSSKVSAAQLSTSCGVADSRSRPASAANAAYLCRNSRSTATAPPYGLPARVPADVHSVSTPALRQAQGAGVAALRQAQGAQGVRWLTW